MLQINGECALLLFALHKGFCDVLYSKCTLMVQRQVVGVLTDNMSAVLFAQFKFEKEFHNGASEIQTAIL